MPPAVSRPWLMTCRSAMKSAIPIRIRITPIVGGITNIAAGPCGQSMGLQVKIASSLTSDCTPPWRLLRVILLFMVFDASERQTQDPGAIQSHLKGRLNGDDH